MQKILNADHQIQVQLSSLMWDYDHDILPPALKLHFKRTNLVLNYSARAASTGCLHYSKVNTTKYGINSFKYQGVKIFNDLKKINIYQNNVSKSIIQLRSLIVLACGFFIYFVLIKLFLLFPLLLTRSLPVFLSFALKKF